jgi:hypothetical protein
MLIINSSPEKPNSYSMAEWCHRRRLIAAIQLKPNKKVGFHFEITK